MSTSISLAKHLSTLSDKEIVNLASQARRYMRNYTIKSPAPEIENLLHFIKDKNRHVQIIKVSKALQDEALSRLDKISKETSG